MSFSNSTAFEIYSKRALMIMACRIYEELETLCYSLYQHIPVLLLHPLTILFIWWFLNAEEGLLIVSEEGRHCYLIGGSKSVTGTVENDPTFVALGDSDGTILVRNNLCCCETRLGQSSSGDLSTSRTLAKVPTEQLPKIPQVTLRNTQPKTSFLDLRLNDISNRSLKDSIWAVPTKASPSPDKTPTQKSYGLKESKANQHTAAQNENGLCSNQAERTERQHLERKMKAFERQNMAMPALVKGALQVPKKGPVRLRKHRSFPKLRHSVLAWWAAVEQEQIASPESLMESEVPYNAEEHDDCSVCDVIQPWDSWSAAVHNLRSANGQKNNIASNPRRIFTNFDPAKIVSRTQGVL